MSISFHRLFLACLLLTACVLAPFSLPAFAAAVPKGIPNFQTVSDGIYRGAAPTYAGLQALRAMGIRTIIDLRISPKLVKVEKKNVSELGMTWINLPMGKEAPTKQQVETLLDTLAKAPERPVFVHCQHGADRTGCMIGIYRVQVQGWSFAQAWAEMRKYGYKPHLSEMKEAVRSWVQKT
ncbi:MAG: protein tyrosine phosphatase family protein [Armatimonadota bacterium]